MKILIVTPLLPYPAEKTGGVHTINKLLENSIYEFDIFYYGEKREERNENKIKNVKYIFYEDLRKRDKLTRIKSIFALKTYTTYMYKKKSEILNQILKDREYDLIVLDQFASIDFIKDKNVKLAFFSHDSLPLLFSRKKELSKGLDKIYYKIQESAAVNEENKFYQIFDKIFFVSDKDIEYETKIHPTIRNKFALCSLGVDFDEARKAPYIELKKKSLVFTGVMDYAPNEDAMIYFVKNIFPLLKEKIPDIFLYIVGKNPTKKLLEVIKDSPNIIVTGRVESIYSYINSAYVYISPLRYGSGKKNKILEAIAGGIPIIASPISMEGFDNLNYNKTILIPKNDKDWIFMIEKLFKNIKEYKNVKEQTLSLREKIGDWSIIANDMWTQLIEEPKDGNKI